MQIQFHHLRGIPPFDEVAVREEFLRRLYEMPGTQFSDDAINRNSGLPLKALAMPEAMATLLAAFEWFLAEAVKAPALP